MVYQIYTFLSLEAKQRALRNDLKTVHAVQINEGLQYKQLLPTPSRTQ